MSFTIDVGSARVTQLTELAHWPFPPRELFPQASEAEVEEASARLTP